MASPLGDECGREHAKHLGTKIDAQRWLDETTAAVVTGQYVDPGTPARCCQRTRRIGENVQVATRLNLSIIDNAVRLHINPALGGRRIGSIRQSEVQVSSRRWRARASRPVLCATPTTRRRGSCPRPSTTG